MSVNAPCADRPSLSGDGTSAVGRQRTGDPPWATSRAVAFELFLLGAVFVVYQRVRLLVRDEADRAFANAGRVVGWERSLHVFREVDVQTFALRGDVLIGIVNRYYVGVHFPATAMFVVWVLVRHRSSYRSIRTWMLLVTAGGLALHVVFPLAPPRMLADPALVDTLREYGPSIYPTDTSQSVANQFAAMPSLHFGWALLVSGGIISIVEARTRWLAVVHPLFTLIAIIATANHYFLDAAVAGVLVASSGYAIGIRRGRPTRLSTKKESRVSATEARPHTRRALRWRRAASAASRLANSASPRRCSQHPRPRHVGAEEPRRCDVVVEPAGHSSTLSVVRQRGSGGPRSPSCWPGSG